MSALCRSIESCAIHWTGVWLALLVTGLLPIGANAADDDDAAFVLEKGGVWLLNGKANQEIRAGDKLPAGATFVPKKPGPDSFITVCFFTGKAQTFTEAKEVPKRESTSFFSRIAATVRGNYRSGVVHAISRGDGLVDGIVPLADGKVVLSSIAHDLPAGSYLLQWVAIVDDLPAKSKPISLSFEWDPESPEPIAVTSIAAGIYRVSMLDKRSKRPTGAEVLVLVSDGDGYAARRKLYDEVVARMETDWDAASRKKAGAEFRHACLRSLASVPLADSGGENDK